MAARYQRELDFTRAVLGRLRIAMHFVGPQSDLHKLDGGLRSMLGVPAEYESVYRIVRHWSNPRTIYTYLDQFRCHYIYFFLPDTEEPTAVVIGPYLTQDMPQESIMELAEQMGLSLGWLPRLTDYYAMLPICHDPAFVMSVLSTLGETLWGSSQAFDLVDLNVDHGPLTLHSAEQPEPIEHENILQRMAQLEERYAYENQLMEIVAKGLTNRAEMMMSSVSQLSYQSRAADPLRNMKNYCIICNTLLRKAAQQGGVHPLHLDETSSQFARRIESASTLSASNALIGDMIRTYCRLVRTHSGSLHSAVVQKTLAYIAANLSGDLSLKSLAKLMQISPGYLSALFHKETGQTLIEHISDLRMKTALQLLRSTHLQVQTVAQLTGFTDPNYFGRQFKRFFGVTPLQYRQEQGQSPLQPDA